MNKTKEDIYFEQALKDIREANKKFAIIQEGCPHPIHGEVEDVTVCLSCGVEYVS